MRVIHKAPDLATVNSANNLVLRLNNAECLEFTPF